MTMIYMILRYIMLLTIRLCSVYCYFNLFLFPFQNLFFNSNSSFTQLTFIHFKDFQLQKMVHLMLIGSLVAN